MEDHSPQALQSARKLRKELSLPEVLLWRLLRGQPRGIRFRRQHPVGEYVADFYCAQARVIVEIDGRNHDAGSRPERDQRRDVWLQDQGYAVVRIAASEVLKDVASVADAVLRRCREGPPPSSLRDATSPRGGGFSQ